MCGKKVFISYSRSDKNVVEAIVKRIESELYNDCCWIDVDGIESGQMFWDVIINAVKKCNAFLLMASDRSMSSDNVLGEIQIAKNNSKNIVPVIIDKSVLKNDRFLAHFPINNYILSDNPDHMSRLIHDLKNWCYIDTSLTKRTDIAVNNSPADVCLKVLSNLDCNVLIDCEEKIQAVANRLAKIALPVGEYYVEFISTENPADAIARKIILEHDKLEKVDLLSLKHAREKSETERLACVDMITLVPYISNNKVGFADLETRKIIVPCKYEMVDSYSDGLAAVKLNGYWGYVDKSGKESIPCRNYRVMDFRDGLARVQVTILSKYSYIDKSGRAVISCKYDRAESFSEGLAKIGHRIWGSCSNYGYIDKSGREVIPCKYDFANSFSDGLAAVKLNDKWGYIDKSGREVIPCKYDSANSFSDGLAAVKLNDKWGYIDKSGREVIPCKYNFADSFSDGLAAMKLNDRWGYIDKSGREVMPSCYHGVFASFSEGLGIVIFNDKCGYIDKSGREVIPCRYSVAYPFSDGLAAVKLNDKWGYIDKSGREVISCKYDDTGGFRRGLASVYLNNKLGYIDRFGNEMWLEE